MRVATTVQYRSISSAHVNWCARASVPSVARTTRACRDIGSTNAARCHNAASRTGLVRAWRHLHTLVGACHWSNVPSGTGASIQGGLCIVYACCRRGRGHRLAHLVLSVAWVGSAWVGRCALLARHPRPADLVGSGQGSRSEPICTRASPATLTVCVADTMRGAVVDGICARAIVVDVRARRALNLVKAWFA